MCLFCTSEALGCPHHRDISALPWFFGITELRHSQATLGKQHGAQQYQTISSALWGGGGAFYELDLCSVVLVKGCFLALCTQQGQCCVVGTLRVARLDRPFWICVCSSGAVF